MVSRKKKQNKKKKKKKDKQTNQKKKKKETTIHEHRQCPNTYSNYSTHFLNGRTRFIGGENSFMKMKDDKLKSNIKLHFQHIISSHHAVNNNLSK